jgi:hypothetical protein
MTDPSGMSADGAGRETPEVVYRQEIHAEAGSSVYAVLHGDRRAIVSLTGYREYDRSGRAGEAALLEDGSGVPRRADTGQMLPHRPVFGIQPGQDYH